MGTGRAIGAFKPAPEVPVGETAKAFHALSGHWHVSRLAGLADMQPGAASARHRSRVAAKPSLMNRSRVRYILPFVLAFSLGLPCAPVRAGEPERELPEFVGVLRSPSTGAMVSIRWTSDAGVTLQAWGSVGQRIGPFEIQSFDDRTDTLVLKHASGKVHRIALPDSRVTPALGDEEFATLKSYLPGLKDVPPDPPVLSREKARAFWLRFLESLHIPPDPTLLLDFTGASLPAGEQAEYRESMQRAKTSGQMIALEVRNDGERHGVTFPTNFFSFPEPFLRNLAESDREELDRLTLDLVARAQARSTRERRAAP